LLDDLAALPWPVGVVVGVAAFLAIRHGIPALLSTRGGPLAQGLALDKPLGLLAWLVLAVCFIAAFMSFLGARRRRQLLDTRTGLESISALGWRDFESLVGEAFRRRGYTVEETGLGGADGGIDLILRRDGRRILVQCKQWRRQKVPVNVVREMYGLLTHHAADEVRIATLGGFTGDAERFARGKPIELMNGETLLEMIQAAQSTYGSTSLERAGVDPTAAPESLPDAEVPVCPRCGKAMVTRTNRRNGESFWGCSSYPECKGTRQWNRT